MSRTGKILMTGAKTLGRSMVAAIGPRTPEKQAQYWVDVGTDWVRTLGELKGAAMKLGQMASQYADVMPPALAEQLKKLQRDAEPVPFAQLEAQLASQWSAKQRARVQTIDPTPIAAASVGQVHRAQLADGRCVVIKIRYPGVREHIDDDLSQLKTVLRAGRLLKVDQPTLDALFAEIRERFREETDYAQELENLRFMRAHTKLPGVIYPEPIEALCTDGVLVLTEVSARPLSEAAGWSEEVRNRLGTHLLEWMLRQIFEQRTLHADPHAGNFGCLPDGQLVVYDFGCVKRLDEPTVERLRAATRACLEHDWRALYDRLWQLGALRPDPEVPQRAVRPYAKTAGILEAWTKTAVDPLLVSDRFDFGDGRIIDDCRALARQHLAHVPDFRPIPELTFVSRTVSGVYWLLRSMRSSVPIRELVDQIILQTRTAA